MVGILLVFGEHYPKFKPIKLTEVPILSQVSLLISMFYRPINNIGVLPIT